jgi:hypothetical protein
MVLFGFTLSPVELIVIGGTAYYLFAWLSYALPEPTAKSWQAFVFFYKSVHFAAANLSKLRSRKPE